MSKQPYIHYWYSRRAIERLLGEIRPAVAYHIRRLEEYGGITPQTHQKASVVRKEGGREVYRNIDIFDIFALRAIAYSFTSERATEIVKQCDEVIVQNDKADYSKQEMKLID